MTTRKRTRKAKAIPRLDGDTSILAFLIAAMAANGHVSPEEGARANNIIWSMRRFRDRSGETVGRKIEKVRVLLEAHGEAPIIDAAARAIPARLRSAVFAVAIDVMFVDNALDRRERRFVEGLAAKLGLDADEASDILDVIGLKNSV